MTTIISSVPGLKYPFPDLKNEHADRIEAATKTWLQNDYGSLPYDFQTKQKKYKYWETNVGHMGARMYPVAGYTQLIPIARFLLWGLSNDDYYEDCTMSQLQALRERAVAILKGYPLQADDNELFHQLHKQRNEMMALMPAWWMARYTLSIDRGFEGMQLEAPYKATLQYPSVADYMAIREKAVLVYPLIDLVELQIGTALPDDIFYHPHIQRINALVCRILAWCNDYFSVRKERGKDVMNLILVIENEEKLSLEDAYRKAIAIHDQDVAEFIRLRDNLPADFGNFKPAVDRFIHHLGLLISGHKSWYEKDTLRYKVKHSN
ncbi:terpene synthase family protein [Chitinophaga sp. MM2321]|uniref:terpene synthase family protein n=1 Tax=Chitinophaga sp. MM2321 TaxID=3137178 RepID=UPI0032D58CDE